MPALHLPAMTDGTSMRPPESTSAAVRRCDAIRATLGERFVPVALRGLPKMLVDGGTSFSFKAHVGPTPEAVRNEGVSERYTAMALIGLLRQRALGREPEQPLELEPLLERLESWARGPVDLGDIALVLWVLLLAGDRRAEPLAAHLVTRRAELAAVTYGTSMEIGFLVSGLAAAIEQGVGGPALHAMAGDATDRLLDNHVAHTGLFNFGRKLLRKNLHRARIDARLGSFASQVYPTVGLAWLARVTGDERARSAALQCAERMTALQGPAGQWWWILHTSRPAPALRYPVFTVHQDAMGPMMLCAAALADGATDRFDAAIQRGLDWFDDRPELPGAGLVDQERGVVWRAVQHDEPSLTHGRLGLGRGELARMGRAAWFGGVDARPLEGGFVCPECRPYHLGWILLADALYRELLAARS